MEKIHIVCGVLCKRENCQTRNNFLVSKKLKMNILCVTTFLCLVSILKVFSLQVKFVTFQVFFRKERNMTQFWFGRFFGNKSTKVNEKICFWTYKCNLTLCYGLQTEIPVLLEFSALRENVDIPNYCRELRLSRQKLFYIFFV